MTNVNPAAMAASALDGAMNSATQIFVGLAPSIPPLFVLVSAFCKVLGVAMIIHSLLKLKNIKNKQNPSEMSPILAEFIAAVALINLDIVIASSAESIFGGGDLKVSPLAYSVQQGGDWAKMRAANILLAIESFIQLVGFISVARGITILNNTSKGKPDASLGKGLTHVIGGVLACNIILTASILSATFLPTGGSL